MPATKSRFRKIKFSGRATILKVGWFLGWRQIRRSSFWTNLLIVFVMTLTFLNLVVVSGILVGLVTGLSQDFRTHYSRDVLISNQTNKSFIEESQRVLRIVENTPGVEAYVSRYLEGGQVEANYKNQTRPSDLPDRIGADLVGIDPVAEDELTGLSQFVIEGEYLEPGDRGFVLIGKDLLERYAPESEFGRLGTLSDVFPGSEVRVIINGNVHEVTVKGIVFSKVSNLGLRVFFIDSELRNFLGRSDLNIDEVAIAISPEYSPEEVVASLKASGVAETALVQTWEESQGPFFEDLKNTFNILGTSLGSIALIVAAIVIFIVIYINAVARKKYIGILKAIGVSAVAIEIAYVVQSLFYALTGSVIGLFLVYLVLEPFFAANPINFPFSDGILVAPVDGILIRVILLLIVTLISGYVPAKIVTKKNSLDAILGR